MRRLSDGPAASVTRYACAAAALDLVYFGGRMRLWLGAQFAVEQAVDAVEEFAGGEAHFAEVVADAEARDVEDQEAVDEGGEDDDGEAGVGAAETLEEVEAVGAGHVDVEDHEVGGGVVEALGGFGAILGAGDFEAVSREEGGERFAEIIGGVDEENSLWHLAPQQYI